MANFPFNDLHSFKDYVVFVRMCAPDLFPIREGVGPEFQWSLDLAFEGLREGLTLAEKEKGDKVRFDYWKRLVEQAYAEYRIGRRREGFSKLEELNRFLRDIPTR